MQLTRLSNPVLERVDRKRGQLPAGESHLRRACFSFVRLRFTVKDIAPRDSMFASGHQHPLDFILNRLHRQLLLQVAPTRDTLGVVGNRLCYVRGKFVRRSSAEFGCHRFGDRGADPCEIEARQATIALTNLLKTGRGIARSSESLWERKKSFGHGLPPVQ